MEPRNAGNMLKHLEKQSEYLIDAHNSMSHQLHQLQVEEEMLMRKLYEIMSAHHLADKKYRQKQFVPFFPIFGFNAKDLSRYDMAIKTMNHSNVSEDCEADHSTASVCVDK